MGETAENIAAERPHITREKQDAFALRSHQCAIAAIDSGRLTEEIIPVTIFRKKVKQRLLLPMNVRAVIQRWNRLRN